MTQSPLQVVVMGVTGAGKTTIARALALTLDRAYVDADDLHPSSNVTKMAAGDPLDDTDRGPWLELVGRAIAGRPDGVVVACSALRRRYRDALRQHAPGVFFVHLAPSQTVLESRLAMRADHFMPPSLLPSQFDALEPLQVDEAGLTIDAPGSVDELVVAIVRRLPERATGRVQSS
jgi:carbohydrate kinase (thermoresistant glucokinase family)